VKNGPNMVSCGDGAVIAEEDVSNKYVSNENVVRIIIAPDRDWNYVFNASYVAQGSHHVVMIEEGTNDVFVVGGNFFGQLGLGDYHDRGYLTQIPNLKALAVYCGDDHTAVVDLERNLYMFGDNTHGRLGVGLGAIRGQNTPRLVPGIKVRAFVSGTNAVACGHDFTIVINDRLEILVAGNNSHGQLGLPKGNKGRTKNVFTKLPNIEALPFTSVICRGSISTHGRTVFTSVIIK